MKFSGHSLYHAATWEWTVDVEFPIYSLFNCLSSRSLFSLPGKHWHSIVQACAVTVRIVHRLLLVVVVVVVVPMADPSCLGTETLVAVITVMVVFVVEVKWRITTYLIPFAAVQFPRRHHRCQDRAKNSNDSQFINFFFFAFLIGQQHGTFQPIG